jgi:hypothetical protein
VTVERTRRAEGGIGQRVARPDPGRDGTTTQLTVIGHLPWSLGRPTLPQRGTGSTSLPVRPGDGVHHPVAVELPQPSHELPSQSLEDRPHRPVGRVGGCLDALSSCMLEEPVGEQGECLPAIPPVPGMLVETDPDLEHVRRQRPTRRHERLDPSDRLTPRSTARSRQPSTSRPDRCSRSLNPASAGRTAIVIGSAPTMARHSSSISAGRSALRRRRGPRIWMESERSERRGSCSGGTTQSIGRERRGRGPPDTDADGDFGQRGRRARRRASRERRHDLKR